MAGAAQGLVNPLQPGQQPTPQQMQAIQQQFTAEAAKQGLTPQQLAEKMRAQMQEQMKAQQQQQQQQEQQGQQNQSQQKSPQQMPQQQQVPIQPGPPKPEALAVAKFLKSQELKSRPCVLQEKRREMFKGALFLYRPTSNLLTQKKSQTRHPCPPVPRLRYRPDQEPCAS